MLDIKFLGEMLYAEDVEQYVLGKLNKKTLKLKPRYINMIDIDILLNDWKYNCLSEKSIIVRD